LVFPISALDLLVLALLHLSLEDASTLWFVEARDFEDLGRVQPRVVAPPHDRDALAHPERVIYQQGHGEGASESNLHLVDGDPTVGRLGSNVSDFPIVKKRRSTPTLKICVSGMAVACSDD
jgi:hypothetical protein